MVNPMYMYILTGVHMTILILSLFYLYGLNITFTKFLLKIVKVNFPIALPVFPGFPLSSELLINYAWLVRYHTILNEVEEMIGLV